MPQSLLDEVLSCPTLPTLPAVAAEVLELTGDQNVPMKKIAQCVQKDQALAGKVLKTVNSSFYGLSTPCGSIERAITLLGMNTVKSLVLGFSLVDLTRAVGAEEFDLMAHWRRAIVGAVSSRAVASLTNAVDADEGFTAGLFQDIGALACFAALKGRYTSVIAGRNHADWPEAEREALGFTHAQAGAALAKRWKLPEGLREAIEGHHAPERNAGEHQSLVRVVGLGAMVGSVLSNEQPLPTARQIRNNAKAWFGEAAPDFDVLFERAKADARTLAKLFSQDIGRLHSPQDLMAAAQEQGLAHQLELQRQADTLRREATIDGLTGLANRRSFDEELAARFEAFRSEGAPLAVIFCDADRFKSVNDTHGHAAGDAVLIELARRMERVVDGAGQVSRYGGEEIAIILPGMGVDAAAVLGERIRAVIADEPFDLSGAPCEVDSLDVTVSLGVSATDADDPARYDGPMRLLQDADACVYAAKSAGRNRVMVHRPGANDAASAATPDRGAGGVRVLFVEDDPLAATLITTLLKRQKSVEVQWIESGTRAQHEIERMASGAIEPADVFLVDLNLPGVSGYELLKLARRSDALRGRAFLILSGEDEDAARDECKRLGATEFIRKQDFVADIGRWVGLIVGTTKKAA